MKFMQRKPNDMYDWPVKDVTEEVELKQLICGPLRLSGTFPYNIRGIPQAVKNYEHHLK